MQSDYGEELMSVWQALESGEIEYGTVDVPSGGSMVVERGSALGILLRVRWLSPSGEATGETACVYDGTTAVQPESYPKGYPYLAGVAAVLMRRSRPSESWTWVWRSLARADEPRPRTAAMLLRSALAPSHRVTEEDREWDERVREVLEQSESLGWVSEVSQEQGPVHRWVLVKPGWRREVVRVAIAAEQHLTLIQTRIDQ